MDKIEPTAYRNDINPKLFAGGCAVFGLMGLLLTLAAYGRFASQRGVTVASRSQSGLPA